MNHFFMGNNYDDFYNFIENIIFNKNIHHLVFDENNILKRIEILYGITDEISTITIGKQYEFQNNIPKPYFNYIFNCNHNKIYHILLDEKQYALLNAIGETLDNIYLFESDKYNFNEILVNIKYSYLKNSIIIQTEEDKQYCWEKFENYANEYFKIINVNEPKIYNKYDEDYHYEEIYDKIYDLQIKHKNNIMKEIVDKYYEIYK